MEAQMNLPLSHAENTNDVRRLDIGEITIFVDSVGNVIYKNKPKKAQVASTGYFKISIRRNGKTYQITLHRLVAMAFLPNPENKRWVNHKDGNKQNNHVDNLEWCTPLENMRHAIDSGLMNNRMEQNGMAKLSRSEVLEIKKMLAMGERPYTIAKKFRVRGTTISKIKLGKRWAGI